MAENKEPTIWGIHAGRTGDADRLFLESHVVAIGWEKMGDLSQLSADRSAFKDRVQKVYPEKKPGAIPVSAGQMYRFVHEMVPGDYVIYPSKSTKTVHIGEVTGEYQYRPEKEPGYPHQRTVKWIEEKPRTHFSQGALYEIGSAMSLFQVKNYAEEFLNVLEGMEPIEGAPDDETTAFIAEEIEQATRDFILRTISRELKGHPFATFVAHLLNQMGYRTRVSEEGPDRGIDIIAHKDELGFEPPIIKVQVKSGEGTVGDPEVSALYGKVEQSEFGLFVTLSSFTRAAADFAQSRQNLRLIDGDKLVDLVLTYFDDLDPRYQGLIPLKHVFVPEPIQDASDD